MSAWVEQVDNWLQERIRNLKIFAFLYLALTFILLLAAIWFYDGSARRAAEDANKLAEPDTPGLVDFNDTAINPNDGTMVVVGDEASIQIISDKLKIKRGKVKYDGDQADKKRSDLHSIALSGDGKTAIAAGDDGLILVSRDSGKSWNAARTNTGNDFTEIALSKTGKIAVAVGDRGLIRFSHDRGRAWFTPETPLSKDLNGVAISDDGKTMVAVTEDDEVLVSKDEGRNWKCKAENSCNSEKSRRDLEAVAFYGKSNTGAAIAVGDDGAILTSCNGRFDWSESNISSNGRKVDFNAVAFSGDGKTAIAVGRRGFAWVSNGLCTDNADDKTSPGQVVGNDLEAVELNKDGRIAVAAGKDGTVLVSRDAGKTWKSLDTGTAMRLYGIALSNDAKNGIVVGQDSTVLHLSSSTSTTLLDTVEIVKEAVLQGGDKRKAETSDQLKRIASIFTLTERFGTVVILLIMVHYLMSLARYNLRLAAFYQARSDTIHLNNMMELPRPEDVDELGRMMEALSPDGLDFGQSPKTAVDLAMQLARTVGYDRKSPARRE